MSKGVAEPSGKLGLPLPPLPPGPLRAENDYEDPDAFERYERPTKASRGESVIIANGCYMTGQAGALCGRGDDDYIDGDLLVATPHPVFAASVDENYIDGSQLMATPHPVYSAAVVVTRVEGSLLVAAPSAIAEQEEQPYIAKE
jgi:hypothetical protein